MIRRKKFENVEDPHELLASLVDYGSVDIEDAFLACLGEMSDAECKRVLAKCGDGFATCDNCDEFPADAEDGLEDEADFEEPEVEDSAEEVEVELEEEPDENEEIEETEDVEETELEARIRRLERKMKPESMNRNRFHRVYRKSR